MIEINLKKKMDLVMHPIRMRIIQTLVINKNLSTQQISDYLPDVPQATLYRHINKLVEADFIKPVLENKVRGTVEKIYALSAVCKYLQIKT
ncbi:MAG: helix-turn-helix domain-containing protein [Alkalibacterium sp.]|nr:helix-turn-helix domain-containing protein [Alkalibacterium sp.]